MCELFGYSGKYSARVNNELKEFFSHGEEHPNGWGLVVSDNGHISIEKEPLKSTKSFYLKERLKEPVEGSCVLAHIRRATIGTTEYRNAHPFTGTDRSGRKWILIHNGTIFESANMDKYVHEQSGETDSERILLYILDKMDQAIAAKSDALTPEERFSVLEDLIYEITPSNKVNLIIYDGELMYVHTNFKDSLYYSDPYNGIYISTRPLSSGQWKNLPLNTLIALRSGEEAFRGKAHGNEYFDNEENMKLLFLAYSGL